MKYLLLLLIIISACSPYRFTLHTYNHNIIEGYKLNSSRDVDVKWSNAFVLNKNADISLRTIAQTQGTWDLSYTLKNTFTKADSIIIASRNILFERENRNRIKIIFTRDTISYEYENIILNYPIPASEKSNNYRLKIFNFASTISIHFNCTKIFESKITLPNTEYLFIKNISASSIYFYGIDFALIK